MPNLFRKKPVVIEAVQWLGTTESLNRLYDWLQAHNTPNGIFAIRLDGRLSIYTLEDGPNREAAHVADKGDWIIRGVKGEYYACKPDIFAATYDAVATAEECSIGSSSTGTGGASQ
jgi:hypothetical protein